MTQPESALEQLVDDATWQPDWQDVEARAGVSDHRRRSTARRVVIAVAVAAAVIIPLAAVAAANDWWFFRTPGAPTPTSAPVVVTTGAWDGHRWQLVAYPSTTDGLCVGIVPGTGNDNSAEGTLGCGPISGIPRTTQTKPGAPDMKIIFMTGSGTKELPPFIVGPIIEDATTVAIRFSDGTTIHTPTIAGPPPLDHVRFFAMQLPASEVQPPGPTHPSAAPLEWIAGLDHNGRVIACLAPAAATNGLSPLSACN